MSHPVVIDVWSDVVCPWCFIGRRRLQKAITKHSAETLVAVRHRAFQLQPDIQETVRTDEILASKYRVDKSQVASMQANVCSIADGEGLCYDLSETMSGNTVDAHRLILWAEANGHGDAILEALYSAYFEKKRNIFTHQDLLAIASEVGLDIAAVTLLLDSDEYKEQVAQEGAMAQQLGANGVPFYVGDMRLGISGAQPQEVFDSFIEELISTKV